MDQFSCLVDHEVLTLPQNEHNAHLGPNAFILPTNKISVMVSFTDKQFESLELELELIGEGSENVLQKSERSYQAVRNTLNTLKAYILDYSFRDKSEEIQFFKEVKPRFLKELIYFKEIEEIESHRPFGNDEMLIGYYHHVLERISIYFARNQYLHNYHLLGKTIHDEEFFLRASKETIDDTAIDTRFCTVYSHKLSKLMAFEMVREYLQKSIYQLEHPGEQPVASSGTEQNNQWTDSKVALIELAYALQSRGSINNGKQDVKQVVGMFEKFFNIDLGNYYAVFQQNIRIRKKSRTVYLDQLKEYLERRMDDSDENPRFSD